MEQGNENCSYQVGNWSQFLHLGRPGKDNSYTNHFIPVLLAREAEPALMSADSKGRPHSVVDNFVEPEGKIYNIRELSNDGR